MSRSGDAGRGMAKSRARSWARDLSKRAFGVLMPGLTFWVALGLALAVAGGFLGHLHPVGDSLAVFRIPLVLLLVLVVIWGPSGGARRWGRVRGLRWSVVCLCLALLGWHAIRSVPSPLVAAPAGSAPMLRLYQQNMLLSRGDSQAWRAHVASVAPDVLTLQEVSVPNRQVLAAMQAEYPHQHLCPIGHHLGEAVLSRHPMVAGSGFCSNPDGISGVQILTAEGPVWVVSLHVSWPWPFPQAEQISGVLPYLQRLEGPVVVAGDFNAVAWSHTVHRVAGAIGGHRVGPWGRSFNLPKLGMPIGIDHVLTTHPDGARLEIQPKLGSDHHGVLVDLSLVGPNG